VSSVDPLGGSVKSGLHTAKQSFEVLCHERLTRSVARLLTQRNPQSVLTRGSSACQSLYDRLWRKADIQIVIRSAIVATGTAIVRPPRGSAASPVEPAKTISRLTGEAAERRECQRRRRSCYARVSHSPLPFWGCL
jgi:hypothetical protein